MSDTPANTRHAPGSPDADNPSADDAFEPTDELLAEPRMPSVSIGPHFEMHPVVFPVAASVVLLFVSTTLILIGAGFPVEEKLLATRDWIGATFGWFYIASMTAVLGLAVWLAASRFGKVKLGKDDEPPEFNTLTWFAMLFSAGMGVGLMFWGVAEPAYHMASAQSDSLPVPGGQGYDTARTLGVTVFHWGLHPWALYAVVGLALAYAGFRRDMPLSFRSLLHPLFGDRMWGRFGDLVDVLAIVATLCGVAASLGMGATQVNAGLAFLFGFHVNETIQVGLIAFITLIAGVSVVLGLGTGIRRLSEANMVLAAALLLAVIVSAGIAAFAAASAKATAGYAALFPFLSVRLAGSGDEAQSWVTGWTILYWAWWIAWSPFVGMFIARVSRGRTIREFITGVMVVPTIVTIAWFAAFGGATLDQQKAQDDLAAASETAAATTTTTNTTTSERNTAAPHDTLPVYSVIQTDEQGSPLLEDDGTFQTEEQPLTAVEYLSAPISTPDGQDRIDSLPTVLFALLEGLMPSGPILAMFAGIATLCVVLFFVTSSDSASMVIDIIASGGNPDPPVGTRLFWATSEGLVAAGILLAGGIDALQSASLTAALPFTLVLILACVALVRALYKYERD